MEFLTGFVIEYSLSVDNIFIFVLMFAYFATPPKYQHRVLFYGILGALIFRGIFTDNTARNKTKRGEIEALQRDGSSLNYFELGTKIAF